MHKLGVTYRRDQMLWDFGLRAGLPLVNHLLSTCPPPLIHLLPYSGHVG